MNARYVAYVKSNSLHGKSYSAIVEAGKRKRLTCKKFRTASLAILYGKLLAVRYNRFCRSIEVPL